jgi:hypothetical protein
MDDFEVWRVAMFFFTPLRVVCEPYVLHRSFLFKIFRVIISTAADHSA